MLTALGGARTVPRRRPAEQHVATTKAAQKARLDGAIEGVPPRDVRQPHPLPRRLRAHKLLRALVVEH
jgi:hypothetical protein